LRFRFQVLEGVLSWHGFGGEPDGYVLAKHGFGDLINIQNEENML